MRVLDGLSRVLRPFGRRDVAVDLGTTNTLVYVRGRGIVLCEPSLVAIDSSTGEMRAVGIAAERLLDAGEESVTAVRPVQRGVITEIKPARELLQTLMRKACRSWRHPRAVVSVPSGATSVERRAAEQACLAAGAREAYAIAEPMAAAIGAGLPVTERDGSLVVNIGGGTSEVAVVALGGIVASRSVRIGGDDFDAAIAKQLKRDHDLVISNRTAEELKVEFGSALETDGRTQVDVRGREARSGRARTAAVTSEEIHDALERPVARIVDALRETLDRTSPELSSDIVERGTILAGGGSLLRGLEDRLRQETEMPAQLAESPMTCVAAGSGAWLEDPGPIDASGEHHHGHG